MSRDGRLEMDSWLPFFIKANDSRYATRLVLEFRKALDRVLNSAFSSLSDLDAHSEHDFANDPIVENFADRVVDILNLGTFGQQMQATWSKSIQQRG